MLDVKEEMKRLETKRLRLHGYIEMKLEEMDYHGIADAAMDLRELDSRVKALREFIEWNEDENA